MKFPQVGLARRAFGKQLMIASLWPTRDRTPTSGAQPMSISGMLRFSDIKHNYSLGYVSSMPVSCDKRGRTPRQNKKAELAPSRN